MIWFTQQFKEAVRVSDKLNITSTIYLEHNGHCYTLCFDYLCHSFLDSQYYVETVKHVSLYVVVAISIY